MFSEITSLACLNSRLIRQNLAGQVSPKKAIKKLKEFDTKQ